MLKKLRHPGIIHYEWEQQDDSSHAVVTKPVASGLFFVGNHDPRPCTRISERPAGGGLGCSHKEKHAVVSTCLGTCL